MPPIDERRLRQLDALVEMTRLINSTLDTQLVRQRTIEAATRLLGTEAGSLLLRDPETKELFFEVTVGEKGDRVKSVRIPPGLGIAGRVVETGEPEIIPRVSADPNFFGDVDDVSGFETRDMICVPVRAKDRMLGALQAINKLDGHFEIDDMMVLQAFANQVAVAIENAQLYQESISDGLTGLYQHRYFELRLREELERAKRYGHPISVMMIDIDHFKQVNDKHGHPAGDQVLKGVAAVIKQGTRMSDIVARYGGEEFAVIVPYVPKYNVVPMGERLRADVAGTKFHGINVTICVGIGYFEGDDMTLDSEQLVAVADKALYEAKNGGRNQVVFAYAGETPPS
ncbi:MAG: hypothetical protein DRQ37_03040 [Gammaproteobacteria bacterium]|nr:MAG: hypothetical protein DRQ37_03040 [Gammaproteobacteria bacterium]